MSIFTSESFQFLSDLEANNSTEWFNDNRDRYETHIKAPSEAFVAAMSDPLSRIDPELNAVPKINKSIRRMNRDVRFSKDKRPYDPKMLFMFWKGDKPKGSLSYYIGMRPNHIGYVLGFYQFSPEHLQHYRSLIAKPALASELSDILDDVDRAGGGSRGEPELKKPALKGDTHQESLSRFKSLAVRKFVESQDDALTSDFPERVVDVFDKQKRLYDWMAANGFA